MTRKKKKATGVQDYGPKFTPRWWVGDTGYMTRAKAREARRTT